jgi:nucleoside-diphosphate-sugar epimerase
MRVMVTGASGYIGRWVLAGLARADVELVAVCRRRPAVDLPFTWLELDLLDEAARDAIAAAHPDIVLHLAWVTEHGAFWHSAENLAWVAASLRLARTATEAGCVRFVGVGTCAEYDAPDDADCEEDSTPLEPDTLYAVAKDSCRRVISAYLAGTATSFAWARLFYLYGQDEGKERLVPSICRALAAGRPARCSRGSATRDFMDVRDTGAALAALALAPTVGPMNIVSGQAASVADIARRLGALAKRPDLLQFGALPERPNEPARITASGARLRSMLNVPPARPLADGLADAWHYWAAQPADAQ